MVGLRVELRPPEHEVMVRKPESIETLEDTREWIAGFSARDEERWANHERQQASFDRRLVQLEKRVIWAAGFAAGVAALGGTLLGLVFK